MEFPELEKLLLKEKINGAYRERNQVVAALTKLFPSWIGIDSSALSEFWENVVYIELPTGQISFHIPLDDLEAYFSHLSRRDDVSWDGHSTEEKFRRLNSLERSNKNA